MKGLSFYLIHVMNQSDYQAQQEYAHEDEQTRKMIDEDAEELGLIFQELKMQNHQYEYTPEQIDKLQYDEIFVFGSNLWGVHNSGAARCALQRFGAKGGKGIGLQGRSYAIPTTYKDVARIKPHVDEFITFAKENSNLVFLVTQIGCGIAGFKVEQIAPLFRDALGVENIILPESFVLIISNKTPTP